MDLAIEIKDLNHSFGKKIICNNMNINFEYGKIYGLLGKNGTGKSTLINLIGNQLVCKNGEIKIFGKSAKDDISILENICIVREKEFFLKDYKIKNILILLLAGKQSGLLPGEDDRMTDSLVL